MKLKAFLQRGYVWAFHQEDSTDSTLACQNVEGLTLHLVPELISHLEDQLPSKTAAGLQAPEGRRMVDIGKGTMHIGTLGWSMATCCQNPNRFGNHSYRDSNKPSTYASGASTFCVCKWCLVYFVSLPAGAKAAKEKIKQEHHLDLLQWLMQKKNMIHPENLLGLTILLPTYRT